MEKFEYAVRESRGPLHRSELDAMGMAGWRLVSVVFITPDNKTADGVVGSFLLYNFIRTKR